MISSNPWRLSVFDNSHFALRSGKVPSGSCRKESTSSKAFINFHLFTYRAKDVAFQIPFILPDFSAAVNSIFSRRRITDMLTSLRLVKSSTSTTGLSLPQGKSALRLAHHKKGVMTFGRKPNHHHTSGCIFGSSQMKFNKIFG